MANKKEPISVNLSKLVLAVSMIVCIGTLFGAIGYLISNNYQANPLITAEENIKNQAGKIMELNDIKKYSLKSAKNGKVELPEQFEISKTILIENFPDFSEYIDNNVWQVKYSGETEDLEYNIIFDPNGERVIAAFKNDKRAVPGIEPLKISFYLPSSSKSEAVIGEDFLITLPANPSIGYSWEADFDENYLMLRSKDFVSDKVSPEIIGAGGTEIFTFAPIKAEETTITMSYGRSWESKPSETRVFKYNIKEKTVQDQDVSVVLDKTEYKKGEAINGSINFNKDVFINPDIRIYKFNNNDWEFLGNWNYNGAQITCCGVPSRCVENIANTLPIKFVWDQKVVKEELPILPNEPKTKIQVESGKYKIRIVYGDQPVCIDGIDVEFTIK